jgi:hypothetical protein
MADIVIKWEQPIYQLVSKGIEWGIDNEHDERELATNTTEQRPMNLSGTKKNSSVAASSQPRR